MSNYKWTYETCLLEAKKYTTISNFKKNANGALKCAVKNNWIKDFYWLKRPIKWSKEIVYKEAKKYSSKYEFQTKSKYAYNKALKEGWLDEFVWLKTPEHKENNVNDKIHCVYAYFDNDNKSIYVGRTNNVKLRHNQHNRIQHKSKKYDTVKTHFSEINKKLPQPVILSENLTLEESQYYEDYFMKYYKNNGWNVINKGKTFQIIVNKGVNNNVQILGIN